MITSAAALLQSGCAFSSCRTHHSFLLIAGPTATAQAFGTCCPDTPATVAVGLRAVFDSGYVTYIEVDELLFERQDLDREHGPGRYLEFEDSMPKWEFAAGALFGVWDATSDVTFKFDAEVEF